MSHNDTLPIIYILLSSNIEPEANLQAAVDLLRERGNILAISSVYQTPPFGYADQPDFLDAVVKLSTPLLPVVFKEKLDLIEKQLGRNREAQLTPHGPLPLDMDILLWGEEAFSFGLKPWRVPHPSILTEAAVIIPLAEIAPDFIHPDEQRSLADIAATFQPTEHIRLHPLTLN